jgi:hypothetical protein
MSKFTVDTLEKMFVYLGCANIPTQEAMDGAIPIESLTSIRTDTIADFMPDKIATMPASWQCKSVCFTGDNLMLSTVANIHWTSWYKYTKSHSVAKGLLGEDSYGATSEIDGAVALYYSEIDPYGKFVKFPVNKRRQGKVVVNKIYNPEWLFMFANGNMNCVGSANDDLYKSKKLSFLAPFLCGVAQSVSSYWRVVTKFESTCPSLTMLTDAWGVKEFWKLRDIPEGKKRREALLHWVSQHWRQKRNDPDVEVYVRKHMRGSDNLTQGNMTAKIFASESDTIEAEHEKRQREEIRKLKQDQRIRQRKLEKRNVR